MYMYMYRMECTGNISLCAEEKGGVGGGVEIVPEPQVYTC